MSLSEARKELDMFGQLQQFVSQQKLFLVYDGLWSNMSLLQSLILHLRIPSPNIQTDKFKMGIFKVVCEERDIKQFSTDT